VDEKRAGIAQWPLRGAKKEGSAWPDLRWSRGPTEKESPTHTLLAGAPWNQVKRLALSVISV
jgi:hypothetical protein